MASIEKIKLLDAVSAVAAGNTGDKKTMPASSSNFVFFTKVTNYVGGTVNVTIQHSPDNGTTWVNLATVAGLAANGSELDIPGGGPITEVLGTLRANIAASGGLDATVDVEAIFNPSKG